MLKLKNISKRYVITSTFKVDALKNVNLTFRDNEFVAILGPSGSGKTTLLNIIGGLDKYTQGDLVINNKSTKTFKERDWDVYRNHRVGFVFQSYNLIPHQTVLSNVELALTIAGLSKEERVQKAKDALDRVGLSDQYYKKPNQLSGGQSQRVAIARALVNDPEILLADEPTGALDTKTSTQILDLIKDIASDRLVIMVTHNQVLAEKYSTRIINLLDGEVLDDSNPVTEEKIKEKVDEPKAKERAKMSWWTTFKLSLQNLISKRNRTILISIASSIGIIGISLVLSLSFGVKAFINDMQDDMLSGNPITVESSTIDLEKMMSNMGFSERQSFVKDHGYVNVQKMIEELASRSQSATNMFVENNITQEYIDYVLSLPEEDVAAIFLDYEIEIKNNIYLDFYPLEDSDPEKISLKTLISIYTSILLETEETKSFANMINNFTNIMRQAPNNEDYLLEQYDVLEGKIATEKHEVMLVLNQDRSLTDLVLAQLGYYSQEEFINIVLKEIDSPDYNPNLEAADRFSYEELMNKTFMWYPNDSIFNDNSSGVTPFTYNAYEADVKNKDEGIELVIVGILEPKETISYGSLKSGFYYTEDLTKHIIRENFDSEINTFIRTKDEDTLQSGNTTIEIGGNNVKTDFGIAFKYDYNYLGQQRENVTGYIGNLNPFTTMMGSMIELQGGMKMPDIYTITLRDLGGTELPSTISIYPKDLEHKPQVIEYLNAWNDMEGRASEDKITLTDPLSLIFAMINDMINVVTIALIGFTTLALIVSSVMIAIITYVSVVERIKEIGVIRSLGGRKRDVSNLFIAETAIIGLTSGLIAIAFTYFASFIINLIVYPEINHNIALFPILYALLMVGVSIALTLVSGLIPSRSAAKKDPVVALRTE